MAEKKKTNPIINMLSHIAMGIGGGLTGQDYLGTFYKWKEKQADEEKETNTAKLAMDKYLEGEGYYTKLLSKEDVVGDIQTRGSFKQGDYANIGGAFYKKKPLSPEETFTLQLNKQKVEAGALKPAQIREASELSLQKYASAEAYRRLGGSMMGGLRTQEQKNKYEKLKTKIYQEIKQKNIGGVYKGLIDDEENYADFAF